MLLRDEMWKIFEASGNINAYLYYKESGKYDKKERVAKKEKVLQGI
ncbi:YqzL family protein [Caldisalinibacter kiritimatiensis]|uniref:YqzL-like protein n=1 Tax=Caldisalinibacter kiritimatiensis TaxID=1304284 RepID=R1AYT5_9FIRM|nr:YqzL family protein [Caldisalinibacter kiritimatiensis]EOD01872.1 hypothetical protein L21TH_0033 [Caldisalinibacter kiritimatiensis]